MNKFKAFLLNLLFLFLFVSFAHAQTSLMDIKDMSAVNIDDYDDSQLMAWFNKAKQANLSEADLYEIAQKKGLPQDQIDKLKVRAASISGAKKTSSVDQSSSQTVPSGRSYNQNNANTPMVDNERDLSVFGSELFLKSSLVFEPNLRIPTPSSYILGPDDEININIFGQSEKKYTLQVNEEGEVYIPNVGPLYVSGLSIEEATQKIKSKLAATIYRALSSGQTKMQLSLGKIRSIRVTVIGQAQKPGTYTVSSLTTLYNLLYLCGGPGAKGSYRSIQLIRGNQLKRSADIYDFLVNGNQTDNVLLQEGDVIKIPYYNNRVLLSGNVKREGKYEMLENESFSKLLEYAGGFDEKAFKSNITLSRLSDTGKTIIDIAQSDFSAFSLLAGDELVVGKIREKYTNRLSVTGSVERPGNYELTSGITLKSLIEKTGGITEDAYTQCASVFRYQKNRIPTILTTSIDSVLNFDKDFYLMNGDSIAIHSIFDFRDSMYVKIEGFVRAPLQMKWRENLSLKDVILASGGLTAFGDSSNIEISRRIKNANVNQLNHTEAETQIVTVSNNAFLEPYDLIVVKSLSGYNAQRAVIVVGDVTIPGKYVLQNSGDKLTDIIKRTKGFRASADSNYVTIRRPIKSNLSITEREELFQRLLHIDSDSLASNQNLRTQVYKNYDLISVNMRKAFANPASSDNLILEDGDVLTVDKYNNLVKISGEIYYPTIVPLNKTKSAKYYIKLAGGFMQTARKSGAMVIYPDGKAKSVKSFLNS